MPEDKARLIELAEHWEGKCNRYVNRACATRRCLMRGGYSGSGPVGGAIATCEEHETAIALRTRAATLTNEVDK